MHPPPNWSKQLKCIVLGLINCIAIMQFTYTCYIFPIVLQNLPVGKFQADNVAYFLLDVIATFSIILAIYGLWFIFIAGQYIVVYLEHKIGWGIYMVLNIVSAYWDIVNGVSTFPIMNRHHWDMVGPYFDWLYGLLTGLLALTMVLYCLALVWLNYEAQPAATADAELLERQLD